MIRGYKEGMEHFTRMEYAQAVDCFENGTAYGGSSECLLMLGKCYEQGLGVSRDLYLAKDYYKVALRHSEAWYGDDHDEIRFLKGKLEEMKHLTDLTVQRNYIESVGWVTVTRARLKEWTIKFTDDGTLVNIGASIPFCRGFNVAKYHTLKENGYWTCDGQTRFYDGYSLNTDFFSLIVRRGTSRSFESTINGRDCRVMFPSDADLSYLYVQEAIMNRVRELLKKRAEVVFPQKLNEVSERIGVPYGKCKVNTRISKAWAFFTPGTRDIEISLSVIQLPEEHLECICVHELMHNFSGEHDGVFWKKFRELGGQHLYQLDGTHDNHRKWPTLKL